MASVSIIGASGAVGSALAANILRSGILRSGDRLQLVARGQGDSSAKLLGIRIDLMDAFDDQGIDIEVVANIEDVDADIVVMCAGISSRANIDRREWGRFNRDLYEEIAYTCALRLPHAFYIIVSNPVELAVRIFAEKLGRHRVVGVGAEQDSLRFARAIAHDLGVSRDNVLASVLGEHGEAMIPLWSSVELFPCHPERQAALQRMRIQSEEVPLEKRVADLKNRVVDLLKAGMVNEAYEATRQALPDARIFVQPLITWRTIQSTPNATANATLRFLTELLSHSHRPLHGQVLLAGEYNGIHGVCGIPLQIDGLGWQVRACRHLHKEEQARLSQAVSSTERSIAAVRPELFAQYQHRDLATA